MHDSFADPSEGTDFGTPSVPHASEGNQGDDPWETSTSLLLRLRDRSDQEAWAQFVTRYTPMIRRWCHRWFAREPDDMVQES